MECTEARVIIGRNVRLYRQRSGISRKTMACWLRTTPQRIRHIEKGSQTLSGDQLVALAALAHCSVDHFCRLHPPEHKHG